MSKKSLFASIVGIFSLAAFFSYSLVFAIPMQTQETIFKTASKNIFINSLELNTNTIITNKHFSDYTITGECGVFGKLSGEKEGYSIFSIKFLDEDCDQKEVQVELNLGGALVEETFTIISTKSLYAQLLDQSSSALEKTVDSLEGLVAQETETRKKEEYKYLQAFIQDILEKRERKYKIPVIGATIPTLANKVPNTGRPYRASYTDGVHHGWDFDGNKGDTLIALDDGVVIRKVEGFSFADFGKLNKSADLTDTDRTLNLDILRGNQVWVKTMKGDVAFYSHMDEIFDDIEVGDVVERGQPLGTMGASGVPEVGYSDYHLHIAIQMNPYIDAKAGKYTELDYMNWDWSFKGKGVEYAQQNGDTLFEK